MSRFFCDANVLFSAAISPGGRCSLLLELSPSSGHQPLASAHVVGEALRNVDLRYPASAARLASVIEGCELVPEAPAAAVAWASRCGLPDQDAPVLAAAAWARADLLVTGDRRHFGDLFGHRLRGVVVASPSEAIKILFTARANDL